MKYPLLNKTSADKIWKKPWHDRVGLYALYLLLILQPLHFIVSQKFVFYREIFTIVFCLLLIHYFLTTHFHKVIDYHVRKEIFYLLLFCIFIVICALVDPGINLYHVDYTLASEHLTTISPTLYVIRNALIYVPMVIYFAVKGLRENEIKNIARVIVFVAPLSVWASLRHAEIATADTIGAFIGLGGYGFSYNSYIPYLTFPVIASFFLLTTDSTKTFKLFYSFITASLILFILFSTSRQSFIFIILSAVLMFLSFKGFARIKIFILSLMVAVIALLIFTQVRSDFEISGRFLDRYTSAYGIVETPRLDIIYKGIQMLEFHEHLTGAGLSSVIYSGPHNDYIRWWQRIGIIGMIIGFMPYFIGFRRAFFVSRFYKNKPICVFIWLALFYTLYHSLFGYPREDVYQSLYCFLGLAIWLGFYKIEIKKSM